MNREEILEVSKKENKNKDPYLLEVQNKAGGYACIAMLVLAFIYLIYELHTKGEWNPAIYSIITIFQCVMYGYRALKIEKDRFWFGVASLLWGLLTVLLILNYFKVI